MSWIRNTGEGKICVFEPDSLLGEGEGWWWRCSRRWRRAASHTAPCGWAARSRSTRRPSLRVPRMLINFVQLALLLSLHRPVRPEIYRDYPRPPSLLCCARNILNVYRETLKQCIAFKRGGGGRGVCTLVLCSLETGTSWIDPTFTHVEKSNIFFTFIHSSASLHCFIFLDNVIGVSKFSIILTV